MRWEGKQIHPRPLLERAIYNLVKVTDHSLGFGTQEQTCKEEREAGKGPGCRVGKGSQGGTERSKGLGIYYSLAGQTVDWAEGLSHPAKQGGPQVRLSSTELCILWQEQPSLRTRSSSMPSLEPPGRRRGPFSFVYYGPTSD